jgi:hypothetical protein
VTAVSEAAAGIPARRVTKTDTGRRLGVYADRVAERESTSVALRPDDET